MANSVKIQDVAASAGVSTATVSYVMNGKAEGLGITPATRERVLEAIRQTGYRPNRAAREMAIGQQPADPLPATPAPDLATILAAAGYSLVPVTSVNELPQMTGIGLVGVLYRQAVKSVGSEQGVVDSSDEGTSVPKEAPNPNVGGALCAATSPSTLTAEPEVPAPVVPPVDADVTTLRSSVPSLRCTSPAASVTVESPPGTNGDGLSAEVSEAEEPQAETSPSTLAIEPDIPSLPTTQQPNNPTTVFSAVPAPVEPVPVVDIPLASTTQQPSNLTTVFSPEPVPMDIEVADQVPETPHPDPLPQGARGSELAPEPVSVIFPTTEQPDNLTTGRDSADNPTTVLPPEPVDIEVATQLPETPHLNPLPQGERTENESTPQPPPVVSQVEPPVVPAPEPIAAVIPEPPPLGPIPEPEPVSVIFPTTEHPDNPTTVFSPAPAPAPDPVVAAPVVETVPEPKSVSESAPTVSESPELTPSEGASGQESPVANQ